MKRNFSIWYLQLIFCVTILLTACSSSMMTQLQTQQELTGNLFVWHLFTGEAAKIFQDYLEDYQQLNPGVKIISEYVPKTRITENFIKQVRAGLGPDLLVNFSREIPTLADAKTLQTIDKKNINLSSYFPQAIEQIRYREKIYGLPLISSLRVLCYNQEKIDKSKDKIRDNNLIQPPKTLEDMIEIAKKGYSVGIVSNFEETFWGLGSFGVQLFDDQGNPQPKLSGWADWLEWLKKANEEPNIILDQYRDILHQAFLQKNLAYYVCDSSEIADFKTSLKNHLGVALLPSQPNHFASPLFYTKVLLINRESNPNQTKLALELAHFMTNPEQQMKAIIQSETFISVNKNVIIDRQLLPIESVLQEQAKTAVAVPLNYIKATIYILEKGEQLQQKALAGNITPEQAVTELTKIVNKEFNRSTVNDH